MSDPRILDTVADGSRRTPTDYTVACICPLGVELAAVEAMLDELHDPVSIGPDRNVYTFGRLGVHNVVIAVMPRMGNNAAAMTATQLLNDFPAVRFGLLVGIGGGVPGIGEKEEDDVRLGDIVVGQPTDTFGGVVQYDLGKKLEGGGFQRVGHLNKPPEFLRANINKLKAQHLRVGSNVGSYLAEMFERYPKMRTEYEHPGPEHDHLFMSDYIHQGGTTCKECDHHRTVSRRLRPDTAPQVHYGTIGSANIVVKDTQTRDTLKRDMGVLCVEMEAAGLMDTFPCLVIRGICDYADSHKNAEWQPYAAATAAAYMKELLMIIPPQQVKETSNPRDSLVLYTLEEPVQKTAEQVQQIYRRLEEDDRSEVLTWISTTPYEKHYKTARGGLLADSGRWLFDNDLFTNWLQSDRSGLFWLRGKPGAGKTKICAMLLGRLIEQKDKVLYFFCSGSQNDPDRQNSKTILRALVHQLSVLSPQQQLPKLILDAYRKRYATGMTQDGMDLSECHDLIRGLLKLHAQITIVVDALDECSPDERSSLLESLQSIADSSTSTVRVFISSRNERDISAWLREVPQITIGEELTRQDMKRFVEKELERCIQRKSLLYGEVSAELEGRLATELLAKADGMFLWVRLQIQLLCQVQTEYQVLSFLGRLPSTLSDTYDQLYTRVQDSPSGYEAQKALSWLMCARQPLRPTQWASAVSWAVNRKRAPEDTDPIYLSAETLLGMCQNLVVYDEMQDHIAYAHISVREYLEAKREFSNPALEIMAAETCLRFMINTRLPRPSHVEYTFYKYSAQHWITHVKACDQWAPPELDEFLGTWEQPTTAYREWKGAVELFGRRYREYSYADQIGTLTNALLLAAYFGIRHTNLWKRGRHDPNATDERGLSLLALASGNGQRDIVKVLVENGATINPVTPPIDASTAVAVYKPRRSYVSFFQVDDCHPLYHAIHGGHPDVVTLLLESGACFNNIPTIRIAASYGPPKVVLRLLVENSELEMTEEALVMAAMNTSYPQTLSVCLGPCEDEQITGNVIEAILEHRGDARDILTRLLEGRITAKVLTGIWRIKRLPILERLLRWVPDLPVTEEIVVELAADALSEDDCVVEVLRALLPGASITSTTLKAIFRIGEGALSMLTVLFNSRRNRDPRQLKAPSAGDITVVTSDPLELLFERYIQVPVAEDAIIAAVYNETEALGLSKLLFSQKDAAPITENIVKAAVSNNAYGIGLLEFFFSTNRVIPITEVVVVAAVQNKASGLRLVELLVSKDCDLPVTEPVIKAAAGNSWHGSQILEKLLANKGASGVSEAAVLAAAGSGNESLKILEILLAQCPSLPITESVLNAAAKNSFKGLDIVKLLFNRNPNLPVTESLVAAAAKNPSQGHKLMEFLLQRADVLPISEAAVCSAVANKNSGSSILSLVLEDSANVSVGISAVRAAAVAGSETWFTGLFSQADPLVIKFGYGPIFLAAIEGGHPGIIQRCIDYAGVWSGTDDHGWDAGSMAGYKSNYELGTMIRKSIGRPRIAYPFLPSEWEMSESSSVSSDGLVLEITGDNESDQQVRANHPFGRSEISYFEVEILKIFQPKRPTQGPSVSVSIGVIDEYLQYSPGYYTSMGYVHDLFLMWQSLSFREGDTVGYGIDWGRQEQFVTHNGVRSDFNLCFEQLLERRMFPCVRLYAQAGTCKVKAVFSGPFMYTPPEIPEYPYIRGP